MANKVLEEIRVIIIGKLMQHYGYCGVTDDGNKVIINSDDNEGNDIKIIIEIKEGE